MSHLDSTIESELSCLEADNVNAIVSLATAGMKPTWMDFPSGDGRKMLIDCNGAVTDQTWMPARSYQAQTIEGFMVMVNDLASIPTPVDSLDHNDAQIRIFVGSRYIEAVLHERGDRRDRVAMPLKSLESLTKLDSGSMAGVSQKSLEWMLRSVYPDRVTPASFLPAIRKLKITESSNGGSVVSHGNETVDMSIEAEVAGIEGGIAEEITLFTSVYESLLVSSLPINWGVKCSVLIDVQSRKFTIKPQEGEVANAIQNARNEIIRQIIEIGLPDNAAIYKDSVAI